MHIHLPYGKKTVPLEVSDKNLLDIVLPNEIIQPERSESLISGALRKPFGTDRLEEIAARGDQVAVVVDDYTRPCPTQQLLPPVLESLRTAGVDDSDVLIIVASGTHTPPSEEKKKEIVGDWVYRNYQICSSDITNGDYVNVGETKRGNTVEVLREYVDADVKILLGDIEYHYFAGYGGTRKSILPGISSYETIQRNHKLLFEKEARTGVLKDNPIHHEMNEAMHLAGCDFAFNVVLDSHHRIVGAWAGQPDAVMDAGVKLVDTMYRREVTDPADIVVVAASGYPHDIDLYQAHKGLHSALSVTKKHGVIILVAECVNGAGNKIYVEWMKQYKTSVEIKAALQKKFVMGAHKAFYHLDAIENYTIIFVSSMNPTEVENLYRFTTASSVQEALEKAFVLKGKDAKARIVPQGSTTLLCLK